MPDAPVEAAIVHDTMAHVPIVVEPPGDAEERGRLKRRRHSSLHSPRRASSPSRGHDRTSGSRYRDHHRKHHRPSSPPSSRSPASSTQKKTRRSSDGEADHTFRGRARNRSISRAMTRSLILEDENACTESEDDGKRFRRRSPPPSRHRANETELGGEVRRQRSYPNLYKVDRRDSKGDQVGIVGSATAT